MIKYLLKYKSKSQRSSKIECIKNMLNNLLILQNCINDISEKYMIYYLFLILF